MHNDYFWHDAYSDYPVVGVTWKQAKHFASGEHYGKTHTKNQKKERICKYI